MTASAATKASPLSSRERVWQAIQECGVANKVFSRQRIQAMTGLKYPVVDDHLERLRDDGKVVKVVSGTYELVPEYPEPVPITYTPLICGLFKIERGSDVWTLTPAEIRLLAKMTAGWANELAAIEQVTELSHSVNRLEQDLRVMRRQTRAAAPNARATTKELRRARLKAVTVA